MQGSKGKDVRNTDDGGGCPKSYVFRLRSVGMNGSRLVKDLRLMMGPHTASRLKVTPLTRRACVSSDLRSTDNMWFSHFSRSRIGRMRRSRIILWHRHSGTSRI